MANGKVKNGKVPITSKDILIIKELMNNPYGLTVNTLKKLISISPRTLYNHLNKLKRAKIVKNIFPIWSLCQIQGKPSKMAKLLDSNKIQLHNLSFVIKLVKKPDWWEKRNNRLIRIKEFQIRPITWGNNPYIQMIKDFFIIQIFSNSIIFVNNKEYWGEDSYDCFIKATRDFLDILNYLEEKLKFKFFIDEVPQVQIRSQHYVRLRDAIAKRCKKTGDKFEIYIDEKLRMGADMSEPLGMEAWHKNYAPEDMRRYSKQITDFLINDPPVASKLTENQAQIQESIKDLINIQKTEQQKWKYYAENIEAHTKSIQALEKGINKLTDLTMGALEPQYKQIPTKRYISKDLREIMKNIRFKEDISKILKEYKAKIILLPKEEKRILEKYLFDLRNR